MASQPNPEQLARSLVDLNRRECLWPMVFNGIKNIVRANNLNDDTRTCMKAWLKCSDGQLHLPMLSLTVRAKGQHTREKIDVPRAPFFISWMW